MAWELCESWKNILRDELELPYMKQLSEFVEVEYLKGGVYPPKHLIFNALNTTPFDRVNVVILGQDPYHGPGQAHGLAFSVENEVPLPPSLKNIYKELARDLHIPANKNGSLQNWANQGILLLNATLTVRDGAPLSHHKRGWEKLTDAIVRALGEKEDPVIFVLWGKSAEAKIKVLTPSQKEKHHFLVTSHPSPLSAHQGFLGCGHFSAINALLKSFGKKEIDWR